MNSEHERHLKALAADQLKRLAVNIIKTIGRL